MSETVHTAITLALVSGIVMALVGLVFSKGALALMGTLDDVIGLSALYMRFIFGNAVFHALQLWRGDPARRRGHEASAVFDDCGSYQRVLKYGACHCIQARRCRWAIATVISQMISCVLVLRCLCRSESSYRLRFSELGMKGYYLKQIFSVGVPAGIQSTVINFSNVLLQSSVNSFGSTAMAGYTAANNLLGLYVSVNSITQAA